MRLLTTGLLALPMLASCIKSGPGSPPADPSLPAGSNAVPPIIRKSDQDTGTPVKPGPAVQLTPEDEIVFTDPDNPESSLPQLSTLLADAPKRRGPWEQSESIAKRRAAREGKPLLIWFTDSARSPMCKALNQELFSNPEFETWAAEKIVRLRVDSNVVVDDSDISLGDKETRMAEIRTYVDRMKKQYKVLGHPVVLMLNPSGEVIGRYRGYKRGDAEYTWGLIKQAEIASAHTYKAWRSSLEKKGYREWRDRQDRKVFAKLTAYSNGSLTLIEPDGTRSRTHENKLSDEDREWLAGQKRQRGL